MRRSLRRCSGTCCLGRSGAVWMDRIVDAHDGASASLVGVRRFVGQHWVLNPLAARASVARQDPKHRLSVTRWLPRSRAAASWVMQHER